MAIYHQDIVDIELASGSLHRSFLNHSIGSADNAANRFGVRVFRNGNPEDLSGASCQAYFRDSHGNNIALTSYGTINGNIAYVTLPQACYNYTGKFTLAIKLVGGGITGTMRIIDGVVDNTNTGGAVAPTGSVPTYQEVLAVYDEMTEMIADYNHGENNMSAQIAQIKGTLGLQDPEYPFYWVQGSIASDGTEIDSSSRIRTGFIMLVDLESLSLSCDSGYSYSYILYDSDKSTVSEASAWKTGSSTIGYGPGAVYARLVLRNTSDTGIDPSEGSHMHAAPTSKLKATLDGIHSDITTLDGDIDDLQGDMATANTNIESLQTASARQDESLDADAAALEKIQRSLSQNYMNTPIAWAQGSLTNAGEETPATNRIRSPFFFMADMIKINVVCSSGYQVSILTFDGDKANPSATSWKTSDVIDYAPGAAYVRFVLRKATDANITPSEGVGLTVTIFPKIQDTIGSQGTRITALETAVSGLFTITDHTLVLAN